MEQKKTTFADIVTGPERARLIVDALEWFQYEPTEEILDILRNCRIGYLIRLFERIYEECAGKTRIYTILNRPLENIVSGSDLNLISRAIEQFMFNIDWELDSALENMDAVRFARDLKYIRVPSTGAFA